ncbi:hypothetical protein FB451DRAFT_1179099 [Mycena latifolia]|nr:hypothetical protein FB451DRAFT_1179099 [Mycena latifolia]
MQRWRQAVSVCMDESGSCQGAEESVRGGARRPRGAALHPRGAHRRYHAEESETRAWWSARALRSATGVCSADARRPRERRGSTMHRARPVACLCGLRCRAGREGARRCHCGDRGAAVSILEDAEEFILDTRLSVVNDTETTALLLRTLCALHARCGVAAREWRCSPHHDTDLIWYFEHHAPPDAHPAGGVQLWDMSALGGVAEVTLPSTHAVEANEKLAPQDRDEEEDLGMRGPIVARSGEKEGTEGLEMAVLGGGVSAVAACGYPAQPVERMSSSGEPMRGERGVADVCAVRERARRDQLLVEQGARHAYVCGVCADAGDVRVEHPQTLLADGRRGEDVCGLVIPRPQLCGARATAFVLRIRVMENGASERLQCIPQISSYAGCHCASGQRGRRVGCGKNCVEAFLHERPHTRYTSTRSRTASETTHSPPALVILARSLRVLRIIPASALALPPLPPTASFSKTSASTPYTTHIFPQHTAPPQLPPEPLFALQGCLLAFVPPPPRARPRTRCSPSDVPDVLVSASADGVLSVRRVTVALEVGHGAGLSIKGVAFAEARAGRSRKRRA